MDSNERKIGQLVFKGVYMVPEFSAEFHHQRSFWMADPTVTVRTAIRKVRFDNAIVKTRAISVRRKP